MSLNTLDQEIKKLSLNNNQIIREHNHYHNLKALLNKYGYYNIEKQGSFGRGTVIKRAEITGFDLDIAVILTNKKPTEIRAIMLEIFNKLKQDYPSIIQKVTIGKRAIKINVEVNFSIDITFICKRNNMELIYNYETNEFEDSYAIAFSKLFNKKNNEDNNNSLQYLAIIYKHIRDSVKDFHLNSLLLEILLYDDYKKGNNVGDTIIKTLRVLEQDLKNRLSHNLYYYFTNTAKESDKIKTGIYSNFEFTKWITFNSLVRKIIKRTILNGKPFYNLQRKYYSLGELAQIIL